MTRLLASVRSVAEARVAAAAGADLIDLKEPSAGALGALATSIVATVVAELRARHPGLPVSATVGDWAPGLPAGLLDAVHAVARCGVDYVKVGVAPGPAAPSLLRALAEVDAAVVPVLLVDDGVDARALDAALSSGAFPALMLDLQHKRAGSLFARVPFAELARTVRAVQASGALAGVAGALQLADVPALRALAPDFAGWRSALCAGDRARALDGEKVREVRAAWC